MEMEDYYKELDLVLSKFKDANELYKKSALFNNIVNSLARGNDPYSIIQQLVVDSENQTQRFQDYVQKDCRPFVVMCNPNENPLNK